MEAHAQPVLSLLGHASARPERSGHVGRSPLAVIGLTQWLVSLGLAVTLGARSPAEVSAAAVLTGLVALVCCELFRRWHVREVASLAPEATPSEDVTQPRPEEDLRQAQKLEAVGRLAAGIAHEINTPAQFVSDSLHFIQEASVDLLRLIEGMQGYATELPASLRAQLAELNEEVDVEYLRQNLPRSVERAIEGLSRVASIVRSMKDFAHPDQITPTSVDLNATVQSTLIIARNEYKYVSDLETDFGELGPVRCFPGGLNQAVLNVVVNAAHAIFDVVGKSGAKGKIRVRTYRDGADVVVAISDTGTGIPVEARDHLYEPFFSTKGVGRGAGQGLAIAHAVIVDQHGGQLTFDTELGRGTTFFLRVPVDGARRLERAA